MDGGNSGEAEKFGVSPAKASSCLVQWYFLFLQGIGATEICRSFDTTYSCFKTLFSVYFSSQSKNVFPVIIH